MSAVLPISLPPDHLEGVEGWARSRRAVSTVYRPATVAQIQEVLETARRHNLPVCVRGAGRSYGDTSLGGEYITLDTTRMNRILSWNPQTGLLEGEPGVTLQQVWEYVVGDGWWPPVVSGTMHTTLGGGVAMNIHGKNNFRAGTLGDWITDFDLLTANGDVRTISRSSDPALFRAVTGGMGLLGVVTRVRLQMRRIHSGRVRVVRRTAPNLAALFTLMETHLPDADHAVGWVDAFARGGALGRGLLETVQELHEGEDAMTVQSLRRESQQLPDTILGVVPKAILWRFLRLWFHDTGMRILNTAQYTAGCLTGGKAIWDTHAGAAFKLDYVPHWKMAYGAHGLLQFQTCVPQEAALETFTRQLTTCQARGIVPYLAVLKRHRADDSLLRYLCGGWSLALDFKITGKNRDSLLSLYDEMAEFTLAAGGRFYLAKDGFLRPERFSCLREMPEFREFAAWKARLDPENLWQTDLYRRLLGNTK